MRFNKEAENSMFWVPIRVRSDKIKPQFFDIAYDVWDTINHPVTKKMISGDESIKGKKVIKENTGDYYVNEDILSVKCAQCHYEGSFYSETSDLILTDRKHLDNNPKIVTKDDIIQILKAINELE